MATVSAGARLHFGFRNLSLAREPLYGGIGVGLERPRVTVTANRDERVIAPDTLTERYAQRAVEILDVPGVSIDLDRALPRHVGLGSGTQLALSVLEATARCYDRDPAIRRRAPAMGRGGRSAVGVATFEGGGFVVDAGHPTRRFTTTPPREGSWRVPAVSTRYQLPEEWRFLVVVPDVPAGRNGVTEDESIRSVIERADPSIADDVDAILTDQLLPAAREGRLREFGRALTSIGRLNGQWYAETQDGIYREPAGDLVSRLDARSILRGVGQSSWGPTVYGVTDRRHTNTVRTAAREVLDDLGLDGTIVLASPAPDGAQVETGHATTGKPVD